MVSGGVARNELFRSRVAFLGQQERLRVVYPPHSLCTDNAVMIAWLAIERLNKNPNDADPYSFSYIQKWPIGTTLDPTLIKQ